MDESEESMSSEGIENLHSPSVKVKPKKRSLVERELETSLTARVTSPVTSVDGSSTSRYGRARRIKSDTDYWDMEKAVSNALKTRKLEKSPLRSPPVYKMHAVNSPVRSESPQKTLLIESKLENTIENIYNANISLSRFGSEETKNLVLSPAKKFPKIYIRKDIIQTKDKINEKEETITLIKNMFSPVKQYKETTTNSHLSNILERSAEKYSLNCIAGKPLKGLIDSSSVVKTLDFDGNKKKKESRESKPVLSKSDLLEIESTCGHQVGEVAWARMGTYPFWPCIITREPASELFVRKKLFGRIERNIIHVTFFGDNGRRSWIVDTMLRKFLGQREFETTRDQFPPEAKRKDPRLYAAFFISEKKQALWIRSVEEAETLQREPKRLRIDLFYDMLCKTMTVKPSSKGQKIEKIPRSDEAPKIARMDSDVSLSESLFDTLFSEDDGKADDNDRPKHKRHKSLDVSEVVTACLDNMAAKTGITKIQRQSHMDRWLQKAKSKTPEKSQIKVTVTVEKVDEKMENVKEKEKETKMKDSKKKKKGMTKVVPLQKPYSFRKSNESRNLLSHHNEHDYSCKFVESKHDCIGKLDKINPIDTIKVNQAVDWPQNDIALIEKIQTNCDKIREANMVQEDLTSTGINKDPILKKHTEAEQGNLSNFNEEENTSLAVGMETNKSEKNNEDMSPPEVESVMKNVSCSEMIKNQSKKNYDVIPLKTETTKLDIFRMEVGQSVKDKDVIPKEESITCDHIVPPNNLNITKIDSNIMSQTYGATNADLDIKMKDSTEVTVDILDNKDCITLKKVVTEAVDNSIETFVAEGKKLTNENIYECINKDSITTESDNNIIDTVMPSDDDITVCESDVDTDFVLDTIDKLLNKEESVATMSKEATKQTDAKDQEVMSLEDEVYTAEKIQYNDNIVSVEEKSEPDDKFCEPIQNVLQDQVLNGDPENSTIEDKITQSVKTKNDFQDDKAVLSHGTIVLEQRMSKPDDQFCEPIQNVLQDKVLNDDLKKSTFTDKITESVESKHDSQDKIAIVSYGTTVSVQEESETDNKFCEPIQNVLQNKVLYSDLKNSTLEDNITQSVESMNDFQNVKAVVSHGTIDLVQKMSEHDDKFCEGIQNVLQDEVLNSDLKKSTLEDKITQSVESHSDFQCNKPIESHGTSTHVDIYISSIGEVKKNDDNEQLQRNENDVLNKTILANEILSESCFQNKNLSENVTNNAIESVKENGFIKDLRIEVVNKELDLDIISIQSPVTDISMTEHDVVLLPNGPSQPIVNGFHVKDHMGNIKNELLQDSDTASVFSELDKVSLNEVKLPSTKTTPMRSKVSNKNDKIPVTHDDIDVDKIESITNNQTESKDCNLPKHNNISSNENIETKFNADNSSNFLSSEVSNKTLRIRVRKLNMTSVIKKENGFYDSKGSSPERTVKEEFDPKIVSVNSEDSNVSITKLKSRRNSVVKTEDRTQDPKFLKYLEATQDALMDEHPELTNEEIVAYLYKSWSYKEICIKKTVETEDSHELQNVKEESTPPKKIKRKIHNERKLINIEKVLSKEPQKLNYFMNNIPRDKPKRKTVQPYYNEDFSDIEDEIQMFEILKKEPKTGPDTEVPTISNDFKSAEDAKLPLIVKVKTETSQSDNQVDISPEEYYDEVEAYFEELSEPKPNVFKGLVREKVCEICEKTTNLVKCKRCNGMFHVECVKKETKVVDISAPVRVRGRKKKKKPRGCKPKMSTESNGLDSESQSDEKSQDLNASDEQNMSIDEMKEPDCYIVADAENFETQIAIKMKEIMETADVIEYDSYSSDDGLDWSDTVAGKCEIIDIKLKPKRVENTDFLDFKCNNCQKYDTPICFVCKLAVSPKDQSEHRQRCHVPHCHKYYHLKCLDQWPQTQFNSGEPSRNNKKISEYFEALTCPRHVCHTCVCDDPRGCKTRFSGDKLARCVRCPATYHSFTKCLPAGTQILTASHIICPRHYQHRPGKVPCHVNTGWCFICALGGSLICCEYCPTSFHAECLNIKPPEGGYMCEDCETGRLPLYGEMVWVKLGHYRWWPGIVLHPCEIPENILSVRHTPGEFVVRFFGQYDHYWVNRGRVFPFQEGDSGRVSSQKSKIDEAFTLAIQHAQRAFEILKSTKSNEEECTDIASSLLPPHYVKLRVNKPCGSLCGRRVDVEESSLTQCECNPDEEDPCGPYSHCLNRMLLTECGPSCRAGERCNNRAFEKRLYPKLIPYRTPHRGWGLKTLEDIKAGQFVIEYVGELIDEEEFKRRMNRKHEIRDENFYFLTLDKERMIDAGPKGNLARFMNHCCEPNCETQKWTVLGDVRVGLFALRDIPANNEVTFNYNLECAGIDKKRCLCGAKRCSGYIGAKPKQDESQPKKTKLAAKRTYKKRKTPEQSPSTSKSKPKRPVGRPRIEKPRELTEIEKDLLIIKNAINGLSSDSECSGRLSSIDVESEKKDAKSLKRKRVDFSTEEVGVSDSSLNSPSVKKVKLDGDKTNIEVGD